MLKYLKLALFLTPTLALIAGAVWFLSKPTPPVLSGDPAAASGGRLVVLVVFDQMRGDYLERWSSLFGTDGFERIKRDGTWYANCTLPYAASATAPGHASLSTGANPSVHGIIENSWYDRSRGEVVSSSGDGATTRVPAGSDRGPGLAPTRILAPTLGEALKAGTNDKGRLYSFALKDRAAVLLGGRNAAGVYCFDNGEFHTSTFYRDRLPAWVEQFNGGGTAKQWGGKSWDRLGKKDDYDRLAGRDDQPGEFAQVTTLPKTLPPATAGAAYFSALESSPFGNELLWDFAKAAISAEKLGTNGTSDVLCLSYSSNDVVGHKFGPDSHEVLDITLRSDKLVAEMIKYLDESVGRGKYTLLITADHGIAPLPEVVAKTHAGAGRISAGDLISGLDAALDETFGRPDGNPGRWVEGDFNITKPWIYLNKRLIEASGVPFNVVEAYATKWLSNRDAAMIAFSRTQLQEGTSLPEQKLMFDAVRNAFHPERSGDVYIVQKPYLQLMGRASLGVDHGSLHDYDRRVFALALGANVPNQGKRSTPFDWLSLTPMVCKSLGIAPPVKATTGLPDGW